MSYWEKICGISKDLADMLRGNKYRTSTYSRGTPTAIGGTMNRFGGNVYWHIVVNSKDQLPLTPERFDIAALVTSEKAIYDATPNGWVRNDSDTLFIGGEVHYSVPQVLAGDVPRVITICKDLDGPSKTTDKTYRRLIRSLVKNGAVLSSRETVREKLTAGASVVIVELNKTHNPETCITEVMFHKPTDAKYSPTMTQFSAIASLLISKKSITIYRHRLLECGGKVII